MTAHVRLTAADAPEIVPPRDMRAPLFHFHRAFGRTTLHGTPWLVALGLVGALSSFTQPAWAIDATTRATLRELGQAGVTACHAEDYALCIEKLERAWNILPTSPSGLWLGRALEKSGRWVEASERYLAATRAEIDEGGDRRIQDNARKDARAAYDALQPRIPKLTVHVDGVPPAGVNVTVNERAILAELVGMPISVDPGAMTVVVTAEHDEQRKSVTLKEGEQRDVRFVFAPAPTVPPATPVSTQKTSPVSPPADAPPRLQPILGWVGVGLGAAGLALGGTAGGMAWAQYGKFNCADKTCDEDPNDIDRYNTLRTVSTVGFITGGVLLATGVTLLLTIPRSTTTASLQPYLAPTSLGLRGTF